MKKSTKKISCADLFCGGGGTSTGMIEAFRKAGVEYSLIGINHWNVAIETNKINHQGDYYCASIDGVDPTDVVHDGELDILWASPECTNHSRAKGGMPRQNQSRCQPEMLLSWIRKLIVKRLYVENVPDVYILKDDGTMEVIDNETTKGYRAVLSAIKATTDRLEWLLAQGIRSVYQ